VVKNLGDDTRLRTGTGIGTGTGKGIGTGTGTGTGNGLKVEKFLNIQNRRGSELSHEVK